MAKGSLNASSGGTDAVIAIKHLCQSVMYSRNAMLGRGMPVVEAPAASWDPQCHA